MCDSQSQSKDSNDSLYEAWMRPCEFAERWITQNVARGCQISNLAEYRAICEEASELLQEREWRRTARAARSVDSEAQ